MICQACNTQQDDAARHCAKCGAALTPRDHGDVPASSRTAERSSDPLVGLSIDGRYRLESVIGKGGMGSVYKATRLLIGDEVAIKILNSNQTTDPHAAERFHREARAAARLKHPNAVNIYDFGVSSDGLQYLVMDLIEGRSLREITNETGPIDLRMAAEITTQVCAALDEAHRQQIIHRDIKPDNIILNSTPSGLRVRVLDFGIAKLRDDAASHLTQTGSVMGTPHYMSPEQCLGEDLDPRADVYSMGIVLYEMLCGRVPFNSPISTAVVIQHVNQPPPALRSLNAEIPAGVEAVVFHALEKRREARPASAGALSGELISAVEIVLPDGRRAGPIQPFKLGESGSKFEFAPEETIEKRPAPDQNQGQYLPQTVHLSTPNIGLPTLTRDTGKDKSTASVSIRKGVSPVVKIVVAVGGAVVVASSLFWFFGTSRPQEPSAPVPQTIGGPIEPTNVNVNTPPVRPRAPAGMVIVNGERFLMGSDTGDSDSSPKHMVSVKTFFIDTYEVTCEEYKRFVDETKHEPPKNWVNRNYPIGSGKQPVTGVSWEDATAFAEWAGKRLPTEAEWEFAARGKSGLLYPWGNSWRAGCANADDEGAARKRLSDVGTHNCKSPFGAQDLIGNAWEWTSSDWIPYPGGKLANPTTGDEKVIRGGSWKSPRAFATTVFRSGFRGPGEQTGFRCVKNAE